MATTAADLAGATDADVAAARAALGAYLQALYPTLSLRAGPLADLVLGPAASALAAVDVRAAAEAASLDPEVALANGGYDPTVLDAALAGRGVTRGAAAAASGSAAVVFSDNAQRTVPAGFQFATADGVVYATTASTRALPTTQAASLTGDVVLTAVPGNGGYAATVPVAAVSTGAAANRPAGTALTVVATGVLTNVTASYAATDLSGGADAESDAALLARLPAATAARTVASTAGAAAVVQGAAAFSYVITVGFGQPGLNRGLSVLTGQAPGRLDVRVRTASAPSRTTLTKTATLVSVGGPASSVWQFTLGRDDAPGPFLVEKVVRVGATSTAVSYAINSVVAGYDLSGVTNGVAVGSAYEAAHSRYSTAAVQFTDTDTATAGLTPGVSTKSYAAVVRSVAGVAAAQAACDAAGAAAAGGDCLVRAAVPVLVTVSGTATAPPNVTLTTARVNAAVAQAVNATGISPSLSAAAVAAAAAALLPAGAALQLTSWSGVVYPFSSAAYPVTGTTGLSVATDWTKNVGTDTVAYYADVESVTVTLS